jgi:hypothetical protein
MMTLTQTLALAYAETLVAYYAAKNAAYDMDGDTVTRKAYNALCDAQNALAEAAEAEAAGTVEDDEYGTKAMQDWLAQQAYEKAY